MIEKNIFSALVPSRLYEKWKKARVWKISCIGFYVDFNFSIYFFFLSHVPFNMRIKAFLCSYFDNFCIFIGVVVKFSLVEGEEDRPLDDKINFFFFYFLLEIEFDTFYPALLFIELMEQRFYGKEIFLTLGHIFLYFL